MTAALTAALLAGPLAAGAATIEATTAFAASPPVMSVTPNTDANPAGQVFAVSGTGADTTANGGIGLYVAFGPNPATLPADWSTNPTYFQAVAWTHPAPPPSGNTPTNRPMQPDGSFAYNLTRSDGSPLTAVYTTSAGTFDCTVVSCGVITFAAHGAPDRTQDSFTPVTFATPVSITTASLPFTNRTQAYSQSLAATGGTAPYTWSIDSGSLPTGLSLSAAGVISGSTTAAAPAGTSSFTVRATDSTPGTPLTSTRALSILVKTPTVTVVPATNANPTGQTFTVTGWGFNPNAPVPGSPTGTGSYVAFGPDPALLPASPPFNTNINYYQVAVWARLNPANVTDGIKAMNADGTFSFAYTEGGTATTAGTPRSLTAAYTTSSGSWDCTQIQCGIVTFRSQGNADRSQDTFTPVTFAGPVSVATTSLAGGTVGTSYSKPLASAGGTAPYTWSIASGTLPAGLTLNASTGVISGVPNTAATSVFTVRVTDSSAAPQTATRALSIAIASTANPSSAKVGVPYSTNVARFAGTAPYRWTLKSGSLPPGLTLNATTGVLRGTPTRTGAFKANIQVTDSASPKAKKATTKLKITVAPAAITISPTTLANGAVGVAYSRQLAAAGGTAPYKFKVSSGTLPSKVKVNAKGLLSGTPKQAGTFTFVVTATDKLGFTGSRTLTLRIT